MDIDAVEVVKTAEPKPAPVVKEIPKPDPADYDMDDKWERSSYKRALMDWEDGQRA